MEEAERVLEGWGWGPRGLLLTEGSSKTPQRAQGAITMANFYEYFLRVKLCFKDLTHIISFKNHTYKIPHFIGKVTEAQIGAGTCPRSLSS